MQHNKTKTQKQKPISAMLRLIGLNWSSYLGALLATVMIVIIGIMFLAERKFGEDVED